MILLHRLYTRNFKQLAEVTLHFPKQGAILIEGHNEAGKSSIFEAVYFAFYGKPLISDRDFKTEYLRTYGAEELFVELDFSIEGRPYSVSRRIKGNQKATLTLQQEDGKQETIHSLSEVNRRLQAELRISPESLLNTCFVEQKRLERLEALNASDRRETINELLNLSVLTSLDAEFRVSRDEVAALQRLKGRVSVARLDAELRALEEAVCVAQRCWLYALLLDSQTSWEGWQREIETAKSRQSQISSQREEIAKNLATCVHLRGLIQTIDTDLTLRARSWQEADTALQQATNQVEELQKLARALPERQRQRQVWQTLAGQLGELEVLESECARLQQEGTAKRAEIEEYDTLQLIWDQGEAQRTVLEDKLQKQQKVCREAEERCQARIAANQRLERLQGMLQQVTACTRAAQAVEEVAKRLAAARAEAERLPLLRERLAALETLVQRLQQQSEDIRERERVTSSLDALLKQQAEQVARLKRIEALTSENAHWSEKIQAATLAEQQAAAIVREAEVRSALEAWAEAAERCAEFSPHVVADTGLSNRIQEAETRREAASQAAKRLARPSLPGYGLLAAGVLAAVIGVSLGQMIAGVVVAVIAAGIGIALLASRQKAVRAAQETLNDANVICATFEGERRTVEAQAQGNAAQYHACVQRETTARGALQQLQENVPATPADARIRLRSLTETPPGTAKATHQEAMEALRALNTEQELARRTLESETEQAAQIDGEVLASQIRTLTTEQERLTDAVNAAADLPESALTLGVAADMAEAQAALQTAQKAVATAEVQEATMPGEQTLLGEKQALLEDEQMQAASLAQQLALPGIELTAWNNAAEAERRSLQQDLAERSDGELQRALQDAQESLGAIERRRTVLQTEQAQHRQKLDTKSRNSLQTEAETIEAETTKKRQQQQTLQGVRVELKRSELPLQLHPLQIHLAAVDAGLKRDTEEVSSLPIARQKQEDYRALQQTKCAEFVQAWKVIPETSIPQSPEEALDRLPIWKQTFTAQLAQQNEPGLQAQDQTLQRSNSELEKQMATLRHQQNEAVERQQDLRTQLGAGEASLNALPALLPELHRVAEHDSEGWEETLESAKTECLENRSQRKAKAQLHDIGDNLLDLQAEEEGVALAEKEIAVKRRAGEIIEKTRLAIITRVMPLTMQNVTQLLPLLTEGRYNELRWDEAANILEVYDTRARSYQRKRVFSGGARDQISLALRLGFALATLPGEHNVRPGWLFLDEPLSSFDRTRSLALVDLLTKGLIRRQFEQIFLISHSETFDPGLFDYRIRMEAGGIAESNLPSEVSMQAVVRTRQGSLVSLAE